MGSKGQSFAPFEMFVGAILALTLLMIIISAINYFDDKRIEVGRQKLEIGLTNAVAQANGTPLKVKEIMLKRGSVLAGKDVANIMGISQDCVDFGIGKASGLAYSNGLVEVKETIIANLTITCSTQGASQCPVGCKIEIEGAQ